MAAVGQEPEIDTLSHLEERIQKAVTLVNRLRQEKDAAVKELAARRRLMRHPRPRTRGSPVRSRRCTRNGNRCAGRIEKLLGHIDQLDCSVE